MPDALERLIPHPLAVVADVLRESLRALPRCAVPELRTRFRVHWRLAGELRRNLDQRLRYQHRDRIEVARMRLEAEPLCLERDRAAAAEWIEDGRRVAVRRFHDLY